MKKHAYSLLYGAAILFFISLIGSKYDSHYGFSELAGFGSQWEHSRLSELSALNYFVKANSGGYDGQFYAQIAFDPSLQNPELPQVLDSPAYRSRRIFLPAFAYLVGGGNPSIILQAYCTLNIIAWIAFGFILLHWLPPGSLFNFSKWLTCMLSLGVLESIRYSLTDLPSVVLMLSAILCMEKKRGLLAGLSQLLALFTKETSILNLIALSVFPKKGWNPLREKQNQWTLGIGFISFLSFALWLFYINHVFAPSINAAGNIGLPFVGLFNGISSALAEISSGTVSTRFVFRLITAAGLSFQFLYLITHRSYQNPIWKWGMSFACLYVTFGEYIWWGHWATSRVALPMTIAFCILYHPRNPKWQYWGVFAANLSLIHGIIRWI